MRRVRLVRRGGGWRGRGPSAPWIWGAPAERGAGLAAHLTLSISSSRTPTLRAAAAHALWRLASALGPARRGRRHGGGGGGRWWMRRRRHGGFAHSRGGGPDTRQGRSGNTRERYFLAALGPRVALAVVRVAIQHLHGFVRSGFFACPSGPGHRGHACTHAVLVHHIVVLLFIVVVVSPGIRHTVLVPCHRVGTPHPLGAGRPFPRPDCSAHHPRCGTVGLGCDV